MKPKFPKGIKQAFKMSLPVMAGYIFLGTTFGLLARASGLKWWVPMLMSALIYSGALQFAAVPVLTAAFDPVASFVLAVTLSIRHLFYGLPMLKKYQKVGGIKPFLIFGLTDETFSIVSTFKEDESIDPKRFYFFVTLFDFAYWNIGTALGTLFSSVFDVDLSGIEFALTALFIVMLIEQLKTKTGRRGAVIGLFVTALSLLVFGKSTFVIASMVLIFAVLVAARRALNHE